MRELKFGKEARTALKEGVNECAEAVSKTFGFKGKEVVIGYPNGAWKATRDGISVAKEISFDEYSKNIGAQMIRTASQRTVDMAGDGTSATAILANSLINNCVAAIDEGANAVYLRKGMIMACNSIVENIKKISTSAKDENGVVNNDLVKEVAMISSNSDTEIGGIVADAIKSVGGSGMIDVQPSQVLASSLEVVEGVLVSSGWHNKYFITNEPKQKAELDNPYILLYDRKLNMFKQLQPILEQVLKQNASLLIFCEDLENEALSTLVTNKMKGGLKVVVVRCPAFGVEKRKQMEDISKAVGGQFISEERGLKLERVQLNQLGKAEKVIVEKSRTIIIGGAGNKEELDLYAKELAEQIVNAEEADKNTLKERYAKLTGGVAIIRVGGSSDQEVMEKSDRYDDSICASRSAIEEGIVGGGGTTYLKLLSKIDGHIGNDDINKGIEIVKEAIQAPFKQLLINAGVTDDSILKKVIESDINIGYNLATDKIEDLRLAGVIDSTKVIRVSLENAISIAGLFVMTEVSIMPSK